MAEEKSRSEKREILPRTVKWEICKDAPELEKRLLALSDGLREYEHWAIRAEQAAYAIAGIQKGLSGKTKLEGKTFLSDFDLYSWYKPMREKDAAESLARGSIPANWVLESCFRKVSATYKSFFELMKRADPDAGTIRPSAPWDFVALQGALNQGSLKGAKLVLAPQIFPGAFEFDVPREYQVKMLARSVRLAKFVISRTPADLREPGRFWVSVTYEIPKPEPRPFVPEEAVFVSLGASSIGIVSPRGEEVIPLWRSDRHWKPEIDTIGVFLTGTPRSASRPALPKGSKMWKKLKNRQRRMYQIMARQQTQDRREVVAIDLIEEVADNLVTGHGVHFVLTELIVRSKEGKLADASKKERGGPSGLNWAAQNTGSIGYLAQWLETKVAEYGGSVRRHKLPPSAVAEVSGKGRENKIPMARALRDDFLRSLKDAA
jgi:hypothetical protein